MESVKAQDYPCLEVVVWDNNEYNFGVAFPSNIAVKMSDSKYTFFLDNDAYLTDTAYISHFVLVMENLPRCAVCFGRVMNADGTDQWLEQFAVNKELMSKCGSYNGSGCLIRNTAWLDVGGYSGEMFAYYLEPDISARLYRNGWYIEYIPMKSIHEQTPKSRNNPVVMYYMVRNHYKYLIRHIPWNPALWHIIKWPVWALLKGRGCYGSILMAHWDTIKDMPKLLSERKPTKERVIIKMWERF